MDNNYNQQSTPYMDNGYGNSGNSYNYGSASEPEKAPNIFQQFALAFVPPQYGRLTKVKAGSMICFVILLTLIATIISFVSMMVIVAPFNGSALLDELPDFEVSRGGLSIDGDYLYDEGELFIFLTDDINGFTYSDASTIAEGGYRNIILAGRDRLSIMQDGEYNQYNFRNLGADIEISKDWIEETFMPMMMVLMGLIYIIFFVGRTFWYFFCAVLYLLCGLIIAQILHKEQPAGNLYKTAVYSKVLMFVVMTIFDVIPGVSLPVPGIVSIIVRIIITTVFMGFAIARLPEKETPAL